MNILFLLQRYPGFGGIETVTKILSEEFCRRQNFYITVFSTSQQPNSTQILSLPNWELVVAGKGVKRQQSQLLDVIVNKSIDVIIYQDSYIPEEYLLENLNRSSVKVIVCEHNTPDALLIGYRNAYREVRVVSVWNVLKKCRRFIRFYQERWKAKKHHRKMMMLADKYILLSDNFRGILQREYGIGLEKVFSIGNPVALPIIEHLDKGKEALFVGRLTGQKGTDYLVQIWCGIARLHPDWILRIVGDGEDRAFMENSFGKAGVKNVFFEGYCSDVKLYYEKASVLFMTSVYEGFGMVLYEAMSQGCIPFAFNSFASVSDIIDDKKNGFLVNAFDVESYIAKVDNFIRRDEEYKTEIRRAALLKAKRNIPSVIVDEWINLINSIK